MKNLSTTKKIINLAVFACLLSFQLAHSGESEAVSDAEKAVSDAEKAVGWAVSGLPSQYYLSLLLRHWCVDLMVQCLRFLQRC